MATRTAEQDPRNIAARERARQEIFTRAGLIKPLPGVVMRALKLLDEPDTQPQDLEEVIREDPVIVGKLLGLVNSPLYGVRREVTTVSAAIVLVGFRGLRSLILASGTAPHLREDCACYGHDEHGLMKHSLVVAVTARALSARCGHSPARREEVFVAGLLHDIGKIVVAPYLSEHHTSPPAPGQDTVEFERQLIGVDHVEAAMVVAAKWNLGPRIATILRHHHDGNGPEELKTELAIVRLANDLSHQRQLGYLSGYSPKPSVTDAEVAMLELDSDSIAATFEEAADTAMVNLAGL